MYLWTYCLQRFHIETAGSAKRDIYTKPTASREPKVTGAKRKGKRRSCGEDVWTLYCKVPRSGTYSSSLLWILWMYKSRFAEL